MYEVPGLYQGKATCTHMDVHSLFVDSLSLMSMSSTTNGARIDKIKLRRY